MNFNQREKKDINTASCHPKRQRRAGHQTKCEIDATSPDSKPLLWQYFTTIARIDEKGNMLDRMGRDFRSTALGESLCQYAVSPKCSLTGSLPVKWSKDQPQR
ncbi:MAG TPA: hypothetical protein VFG34_01020 [Sphingopyxis sp.]|nr:hypothetical protein [Sphingopyxis sp.]